MNYEDVVGWGDYGDEDVLGELLGDDMLGAALNLQSPKPRLNLAALQKLARLKRAGGLLRLPPKPAWRDEVAPGVPVPGEGLWPLPMSPDTNNGVFTDTVSEITFTATPQLAFEGQRLLTTVSKSSGATGVTVLGQPLTVGVMPQTVDIGTISLEAFVPGAFGVRLKLVQAQPGQLIRMLCQTSVALAVGETISVSVTLLGATIRG